jgi:chemotaxis protein histidine kinase CheA
MTDTLMAELRVRFRETAAVRLHEMASLLEMLERDRGDSAALDKLGRHFHALSGLGATYGYPRVSTLGDEAEGMILPLMRSGKSPETASLARWRELVDAVATVIADEQSTG